MKLHPQTCMACLGYPSSRIEPCRFCGGNQAEDANWRLPVNVTDKAITPDMSDKDAMELAYGLLWMVGCDRSTKVGEALYLARKALYEKMDRAGQAKGITAAREALGIDHIRAYER